MTELLNVSNLKSLFKPDENGFYKCICGEKLVNKQYFFYHLMECQEKLFKSTRNDLYKCVCNIPFSKLYDLLDHLHSNQSCVEKWIFTFKKPEDFSQRKLNELNRYVKKEMQMSHIYQPLIIRQLLINDGFCSAHEIGEILKFYFNKDVEYYIKRIKKYPKKVFKKKNIAEYERGQFKLLFYINDEILKKKIINQCSIEIHESLKNYNIPHFNKKSYIKAFEVLKNNGIFKCPCGNTFVTEDFLVIHGSKCGEFKKYLSESLNGENDFNFSYFNKFQYHGVLTCFLIDKWYNIDTDNSVENYTSMDYFINFYENFNLNYNILDSENSHRLQIMVLFSGKLVKSDSISFNRQVRQFGCKNKNGYGIWYKDLSDNKGMILSSNYLQFIKTYLLKGKKIPLFPLLKILYQKKDHSKSNILNLATQFINDFNIKRKEFKEIFQILKNLDLVFGIKSSGKAKLKKIRFNEENKNKVISMIKEKFMEAIQSSKIMGPSQYKKNHLEFFINFYDHLYKKETISRSELVDVYIPNYFENGKVHGRPAQKYMNRNRFGRLNLLRDSGKDSYQMTQLTRFISNLGISARKKTFLHFIIRIPHFLVFCILFAYSHYVIKKEDGLRFYRDDMQLDSKEDFLKIFKEVYKNTKPVGRLKRYYFNMLDWIEILGFSNIVDGKIIPSEKLKAFIFGDGLKDFTLPNKVRILIENAIGKIEE